MNNMIHILANVRPASLVLLDEMGAGTDPTEGAALAVAILEHLQKKGCTFIATTHYSSLKAYATERAGVVNASVEFDTQSLRPTYRLLIGVPGRSNALAIAERLGLPAEILEEARKQWSVDEQRVDRMISALEVQRMELDQLKDELKNQQSRLQEERVQMLTEQEKLELDRKQWLDRAKRESESIVRATRLEAEQLIVEMRNLIEQQKNTAANIKAHQISDLKHRLQGMENSFYEQSSDQSTTERILEDNAAIEVGDEVRILTLGQKGIVVEVVNPQELVVQIGSMKSRVKRKNVDKLRSVKQIQQSPAKTSGQHVLTLTRERGQSVQLELDVRGQSLDDALMAVDQYLSEVVLAGFSHVFIIHGVGTGVLRKGIQQHLKSHRAVKSHRPGRYGEGDLGVTVVELK
jgi:DNA mismatch repair protein MutS2